MMNASERESRKRTNDGRTIWEEWRRTEKGSGATGRERDLETCDTPADCLATAGSACFLLLFLLLLLLLASGQQYYARCECRLGRQGLSGQRLVVLVFGDLGKRERQ